MPVLPVQHTLSKGAKGALKVVHDVVLIRSRSSVEGRWTLAGQDIEELLIEITVLDNLEVVADSLSLGRTSASADGLLLMNRSDRRADRDA